MAEKVVLHYFNGRGKMESIRWLLTVAEVEFDEVHLTTREQFLKLLGDGDLMFQQVPMVEIDGMKLVQTRAILNYIAGKYNLDGKDLKERAMINMYSEGLRDLMEMIMILPFTPPADVPAKLETIQSKATERYLPVFEKKVERCVGAGNQCEEKGGPAHCLHLLAERSSRLPLPVAFVTRYLMKALTGAMHLVGGQLSCADVELLECTLMLEEKFTGILSQFPNVKSFQGKNITFKPAITRFLQPGSKRKPQPDEDYVKTVLAVFDVKLLSR